MSISVLSIAVTAFNNRITKQNNKNKISVFIEYVCVESPSDSISQANIPYECHTCSDGKHGSKEGGNICSFIWGHLESAVCMMFSRKKREVLKSSV